MCDKIDWALHLENAGLDEGCSLSLVNYKDGYRIKFLLIDSDGKEIYNDCTHEGITRLSKHVLNDLISNYVESPLIQDAFYWVKQCNKSKWAVYQYNGYSGFKTGACAWIDPNSCHEIYPVTVNPPPVGD